MKVRRIFLLAGTLAVCLLLLTIQGRGQQSRAADLVAVVTTPVQRTLAAIHRGAFGAWSTYVEWKNVRAENRRLREEVQRLRVGALAVSETVEENQRLRRLLALRDSLPLDTLAGEIIAREWGGWVRSLTVNRGRGDDVRRLTAVISPDGLVGRVVDVRPGSAIVQVLTDPASIVGAHALRTLPRGVVRGLRDAVTGDPGGLARATAIVVGFIVTTGGYLFGAIRGVRDVGRSRDA